MKLRVLGCHGGELPRCRTTCFLIDDVLALDAGALTASLQLEELRRLENVVISHSHFDHVKDLPLLADLLFGQRARPITVYASTGCARTLRQNMFNDALWPDFTRIPRKSNPVIEIRSFRPGTTFKVGRYTVKSIPVNHPVESCGFVVTNGEISIAMSGDTGPTQRLWKVLNATPKLKALLLETSFPNGQQPLADISGHLTPNTLREELKKFSGRNGAPVLLYHLKPAFLTQLRKEVADLPVEVLETGETFEF